MPSRDDLRKFVSVWRGREHSPSEWPQNGVAIEGDFAGIQAFILRPVPGAKGADKRLRGRSFQVSALTALIAHYVQNLFRGARITYLAGGRFLLNAPEQEGWRTTLQSIQSDLDQWIGAQFRGEVVFHLAGVKFENGLIPRAQLRESMNQRKLRPLSGFLLNHSSWEERNFFRPAGGDAFVCPACLATAADGREQPDDGGQKICDECDRDKQIGADLAASGSVCLEEAENGPIKFLKRSYRVAERGIQVGVIHHTPKERDTPVTLDEVAQRARGTKKWLGYLRMDADNVGRAFAEMKDDSARVVAFSRFLNGFFCDRVQEMLKHQPGGREPRFQWIYPVYGGGDDLFVIGPWDLVIDFANDLAKEFNDLVGPDCSFSAGISLAKPKQHILGKSDEAEEYLTEHSKKRPGKGCLHVLGETMRWSEVAGQVQKAAKVTRWLDGEILPAQFVQLILLLHRRWAAATDGADRVAHRPLLNYFAERNLCRSDQSGPLGWVRQLIDDDGAWRRAGFICRYALLARRR